MITINNKPLDINQFPDGTPRINFNPVDCFNPLPNRKITITWTYENDAEMFYLMCIKRKVDETGNSVVCELFLPYVPNARMDRIKGINEVFTLKYFCDFINWLNFNKVLVLDPHSDVTPALLNNCRCINPSEYVSHVISLVRPDILYFPDAGAAKRYSSLFPSKRYCYGEKERDWKTGNILGLNIRTNGLDLNDKTVLMIDDIISYGGSLYYSAEELKKNGVGKIYAYATHTENSILDKEKGTLIKSLENGIIEKLFTSDSLFTKEHEKIHVIGGWKNGRY